MDNPHTLAWRAVAAILSEQIDNDDSLSVNKTANLTGIPRNTLDRKLRGARPFDLFELEILADTLGHGAASDLVAKGEKRAGKGQAA